MIFDAAFDAGTDGFVYADDAFRFTNQPAYARGGYASTEGDPPGALRVTLGGLDGRDVFGMSGGWSKTFTLDRAENVTLTFKVNMTMTANYEADEFAQALLEVDGKRVGLGGSDHLFRLAGDGNGGPSVTTGWKTVTLDLGPMAAGAHTLKFGGFNNKKTEFDERTTLLFDDIRVEARDDGTSTPPTPDGPDLKAFEARVFELTNAFRVQNGRPALENDARLNDAAEGWSASMAQGDFFRHGDTATLIEAEGYDWRTWGENIAGGQQTPEAVVNAWINSPGHRANMLSTNFRDIGIGHVYVENDGGAVRYKHYWTQMFATEQGDTLM